MFRLVRFFGFASLLAFAIVASALAILYRQTAVDDLQELGERNNVALTQAFANGLWAQFRPLVREAATLSRQELQDHPDHDRLMPLVQAQMRGLSVVKVKVYDLEGRTVFSTERAQVGENKSSNAGYLAALRGEVASELTHRDTFSAFEAMIEDRDVISSYVPIYGASSAVEGVFEVYDDVTPLLNDITTTQRTVLIGVVIVLGLLYLILLLIVLYADRSIRRAQQAREQAERARFASEQRTHAVVQNAPLILFAADAAGNLTLLEGSSLKPLGLDAGALIGRSILKTFSDTPKLARDLPRALEGEQFSSRLVIANTSFDVRYSPIAGADNQPAGFIGVAIDVTNLIRAEEALGNAINDLEVQNKHLAQITTVARTASERLETAVQQDQPKAELLVLLTALRQGIAAAGA